MLPPLIIGQAPGRNSDPGEPLAGRCGAKLAELCGLPMDEFLFRFNRVNLLKKFPGKAGKGDAFPADKARCGAIDLLMAGAMHGCKVVLLGDKVANAFGLQKDCYPVLRFMPFGAAPEGIAVCPHPSGVNRWWNEPANVEHARRFWINLVWTR